MKEAEVKKLLVVILTGLALLAGPSALAGTMGGPGADEIQGTVGDDVLTGGGGNDDIRGRAGNDVIRGGPGTDAIFGGPGFDMCYVDSYDVWLGCEDVR